MITGYKMIVTAIIIILIYLLAKELKTNIKLNEKVNDLTIEAEQLNQIIKKYNIRIKRTIIK